MADPKKAAKYLALTGLDTAMGKRFEAGVTIPASSLTKGDIDAYLEMKAIEPIEAKAVKETEETE